jgi:hypothetical protein
VGLSSPVFVNLGWQRVLVHGNRLRFQLVVFDQLDTTVARFGDATAA